MVSPFKKLSSTNYLIGTLFLIPGSVLSLAKYSDVLKNVGVELYILSCSCLVLASLFDLIPLLVKRYWASRESNGYAVLEGEVGELPPPLYLDPSFWNAWLMFQGGVLFLIASFLYLFPEMVLTGTWVFRFGSFSYVIGTSISLRGVLKSAKEKGGMDSSSWLWASCCVQYLLGAMMYIIGGIISEVIFLIFSFLFFFFFFFFSGSNSLHQVGGSGSAVAWLIGAILFFTGSATSFFELLREIQREDGIHNTNKEQMKSLN